MSGSIRLGLIIIASVVAVGLVMKLVGWVIGIIVPVAIVAGIGLLLYGVFNRKALGGGNRRILP